MASAIWVSNPFHKKIRLFRAHGRVCITKGTAIVEEFRMPNGDFSGLRVLSLESRRAQEMTKLIENCGGRPMVAPSMREAPLESNIQALDFAALLVEGRLDMVIFLTGVGTRALARVVETTYPREQFISALRRVAVVARGPKPAAVLREMEVPISLLVPEPNTWRELLRALDDHASTTPAGVASAMLSSLALRGSRVAVQEYGVSNPELLAGLKERGASVMTVPVYEWTLPEDIAPLQEAARSLARGEIDVAMFTSSAQVEHLLEVAAGLGLRDQVLEAFAKVLVASIGPITSEELGQRGIPPDIEPSHPKMGFLVREAAQQSAALLQRKRGRAS
jgi:uroporphyrinogen-III synthase